MTNWHISLTFDQKLEPECGGSFIARTACTAPATFIIDVHVSLVLATAQLDLAFQLLAAVAIAKLIPLPNVAEKPQGVHDSKPDNLLAPVHRYRSSGSRLRRREH